MKKIITILGVGMAFSFLILFQSCKKDKALTDEQIIENALDEFVADLQLNPPNTADISDRVQNYMRMRSALFYGSTVTLLDSTKMAVTSPYWYKQNNLLVYADLMVLVMHTPSLHLRNFLPQ